MVGRDTPRNAAASVMERYCLVSICDDFPIFRIPFVQDFREAIVWDELCQFM